MSHSKPISYCKPLSYCKLTNDAEFENGIVLNTGLNVANVSGLTINSKNGFKITSYDDIHLQVKRVLNTTKYETIYEVMQYFRYVLFPSDTNVIKNGNYYIVDKFILSERTHIWSNVDICMNILAKNGLYLQYVDEKLKTPEMCKCAYQNNCESIKYAPSDVLTIEFCIECVSENHNGFKFIDKSIMDKNLCEIAVSISGMNLEFVPDHLKNKKLCFDAIRENEKAKNYLPHRFRSLNRLKPFKIDSDH